MAFSFIGALTVDPETESISLSPLTGQYWLVLKDSTSGYRALETGENGNFLGDVQHILEDDLFEGCIPDSAFFNEHFKEPVKKLMDLFSHKEKPSLPELEPLLAALTALIRDQPLSSGLAPSASELKTLGFALKDFDLANPDFAFIYSLVNSAIRHRKNQNYDQAVFYYMKALDLDGEDPSVLFNLARVYHETNMEERAISSLKRALELKPDMEMARQFLDFLTTDR